MDLPEIEIVEFNIDGILTMPDMLKRGHQRLHITALFEELHKKGLGVYEPGRRGPGYYAKFTPNEKCPKQYKLVVEAKKRRSHAVVEVQPNSEPDTARSVKGDAKASPSTVSNHVSSPVVQESQGPKDITESIQSYTHHALISLSKTFAKDPYSSKIGYECSIYADVILVLYRVRGGGKDTIEGALKEVWDKVKSRIVTPKIKKMNKFVYTISILKGASFFVLCPLGCKCGADQNEDAIDDLDNIEDQLPSV